MFIGKCKINNILLISISLICISCRLAEPRMKQNTLANEVPRKLERAQNALSRIEEFCEAEEMIQIQKALGNCVKDSQIEAVHTSYNEREVYKDYEQIKLFCNEIKSYEFYEIQAKAQARILLNYTSFQTFKIPKIYSELETIAIQHKESNIIKQCWFDGIEGICGFYFYNKHSEKIKPITNKLSKLMQEKSDSKFYEETYAHVLHCILNEELMSLFLNEKSSIAQRYLNDYLSKISSLPKNIALTYEAKALGNLIFHLSTDMDIAETAHYCDRVIEIASKYPNDLQIQEILCDTIDYTLDGLFWHPDIDPKGVLFAKYYSKLEKLSARYQLNPKFEKLYELAQDILKNHK